MNAVIYARYSCDNQREEKVIPLSYENSGMAVYQEFDSSELTPEVARDMNDVLEFMDGTMLENIETAGYEPVEDEIDRDKDKNKDDTSR